MSAVWQPVGRVGACMERRLPDLLLRAHFNEWAAYVDFEDGVLDPVAVGVVDDPSLAASMLAADEWAAESLGHPRLAVVR